MSPAIWRRGNLQPGEGLIRLERLLSPTPFFQSSSTSLVSVGFFIRKEVVELDSTKAPALYEYQGFSTIPSQGFVLLTRFTPEGQLMFPANLEIVRVRGQVTVRISRTDFYPPFS